jgi:hypothetical protein
MRMRQNTWNEKIINLPDISTWPLTADTRPVVDAFVCDTLHEFLHELVFTVTETGFRAQDQEDGHGFVHRGNRIRIDFGDLVLDPKAVNSMWGHNVFASLVWEGPPPITSSSPMPGTPSPSGIVSSFSSSSSDSSLILNPHHPLPPAPPHQMTAVHEHV